MSDSQSISTPPIFDKMGEFEERNIGCIDCQNDFAWTVGEQVFFRDKHLENPPKRCKVCKRAKNQRLAAIEFGKETGHRQRIEVRSKCARCEEVTTVPFYPSQGRPVYCRACFLETKRGDSTDTRANV